MSRNSEAICKSILALKILDLILSKGTNTCIYPLPKNKQFLIEKERITLLSQLLLIQNNDLTNCILDFI